MAFTDRRPGSNHTVKTIAVSAFHAAVIYGLVTGLNVEFEIMESPIFSAKNHPLEPTPPSPPGAVRWVIPED
jgi:hypothetical protein